MTTQAVNNPEKLSFLRIEILRRSTDEFLAGYTNLDYSETVDSRLYRSIPAMSVEFAPNSANIDSGGSLETKVKMPILPDDALMLALSDGLAFAPVKIRIREFVRGLQIGSLGSVLHWVHGDMTDYVGDDPQRGWITLTCRPDKAEYNSPSGLLCAGQCRNTIFTLPCSRGGTGAYGPQLSAERRLATVLTTDFSVLTVAGYIPISSPKTFARGYVEVDEARVTIADWDSGTPGLFHLAEAAPSRWIGQTAILVPGCNRSAEACDLQWGNKARFNGVGLKMPGTHPSFDTNR